MTQSALKKDGRIDFRVSTAIKEKFNEAASLNHLNLSDYIVTRLMPIVEKELKAKTEITLEQSAWDNFISMLEKPKQPSSTSVEAMKSYFKNEDL